MLVRCVLAALVALLPVRADDSIQVQFRNDADEPMEIWWAGTGPDNRARMSSLTPGSTGGMNSFAGHVFEWVRPGAPNHVVKEFLVLEKSTESTFTRQDAAKNPTPPEGTPEPQEFLEDLPIAVEFINDASETMEVYWRQGSLGSQTRKLIVKIEPGGRSKVNAQAGHDLEWSRASNPGKIAKRVPVFPLLHFSKFTPADMDTALESEKEHGSLASLKDTCSATAEGKCDASAYTGKACVDKHPDFCPNIAKQGECYRNPGWMSRRAAAPAAERSC